MSHSHPDFELWSFTLAAALVIAESVYLRGWFCLRIAFPNLIRRWRLAAYTTGLALVWAVAGSPIAALDHHSLTIHMLKHLALMTIAAPLILAGAPAFPLVCGLPKLFIKGDSRMSGRTMLSIDRYLTHPAFCWLAGTATVIVWHIPDVFQLALGSGWIHSLEDISFLVAGLFFWLPVANAFTTGMKPRWHVPVYLFLATLPCDILSAFLTFCGSVAYPSYHSTAVMWFLSPLGDQECAGALMWVWVTFAYLIPAVIITLRILDGYGTEALRSEAIEAR
jgi:putative membrane protein